MAQIIKHRRGSLESVSGATKRAGELLVVTGSSGITATNGDSILFVGIDGSTATPANKILQGTSVPNLSGGSYDTSIDGIPYYDTSAQKLYILNKGGNVEVKATANTGGTGIVSGSSQVTALLPTGVVSGSAQITISSTTGYSDFSSSLNSRLVTSSTNVIELFSTASDHETRIDSIESSIGGASGIGLRVSSLEAFSGSQEAKDSTLATYTGSVDTKFSTLGTYTASQDTKNSTLATYTGSVNTDLTALHTFTSSQETKDSTLATYTSSLDTKNSTLATYTGSVNTDLTALHTFTSSQETKNSTLATYTGSVNTQLTELYTTASNHETRVDSLESYSSSLKSAIELTGSNVVVLGDLTVKGTTTSVESTTIQLGDNIIELNGSGAANGGLLIKDPTSPNTVSGSLLWDSTNDYWKGGALGAESKFLRAGGDNVVTSSAQVLIDQLNGYSSFSSSLTAKDTELFGTASDHETRIDSIESSIGGASGIGLRVSSLEAFTGSQETKNSTLGTYTGSIDTKFSTLGTYTGSVNDDLTELFTTASNHEGRVDSLESWSSSLDSGFVSEAELTILSGSIDGRIVSLNSFSSSINTTIKTKLNTEGVISGSSQVQYASISNIPAGIVSGSSQLDSTTINSAKLTNVEASGSFSGSFKGDGSQLTGIASTLSFSGSTGDDTLNLKTESLLVTGSNGVSTAVSNNTITISGVDATTSSKGVASFSSTNFAVSTGNVSIKANGVQASNLNSNVAGTGISLNGVDNSIEVDYGSTSGTAVAGNTSLTIQGTSNEIEISGGSVTLGNGGTVTIGLPDNVTISGSLTANGNVFLGNSTADSVTIAGNLYVQGTTTTVDSSTIQLGDNIIELNGSGAANAGLLVRDATNPNTISGSLLWDSTNDYWKGGALGSEKEFARYNSAPTSGSVQVIGASGLLVNSHITDSGTDVVITTDLIINGLTANAFLYADSAKTLASVAPSNAGDMIQWNGSSFVASNTIDGGTF